MVNDPIADFLTRLRNAQLRNRDNIELPATKMLVSLAKILEKYEYVEKVEVIENKENSQDDFVVTLKYINGEPAMRSMKRISKPGLRKYLNYKEIPKVLNGKGIGIYSTPKGVLSGEDAKKDKVGGEYLCEIW